MEENLNDDSTESMENDSNQIVPKDLEDIITSLPEGKRQKALDLILSLSIERTSSFKGPLPPPTVLSDYNKIVENGAERIMTMAEKQSGHRIELEKHAIKEELRQSSNGQIFGFILAVLGIIVVDPTNPLDFSAGVPPKLSIGHSDSAGETIQRWFG